MTWITNLHVNGGETQLSESFCLILYSNWRGPKGQQHNVKLFYHTIWLGIFDTRGFYIFFLCGPAEIFVERFGRRLELCSRSRTPLCLGPGRNNFPFTLSEKCSEHFHVAFLHFFDNLKIVRNTRRRSSQTVFKLSAKRFQNTMRWNLNSKTCTNL